MSEIHTKYIAKPKLKEILKREEYRDKYRNQKELALLVGVKDPTISRFDTQSRYDINTLVSISKELNLPIEELFNIKENPNYIKPTYQNKFGTKEEIQQIFEKDGGKSKNFKELFINNHEEFYRIFMKNMNKEFEKSGIILEDDEFSDAFSKLIKTISQELEDK